MKTPERFEQLDVFPQAMQVERVASPDEAPTKKKIRRWKDGFPKEDGDYEVRTGLLSSRVDFITVRSGVLLTRICEHTPCCPGFDKWGWQYRRIENE